MSEDSMTSTNDVKTHLDNSNTPSADFSHEIGDKKPDNAPIKERTSNEGEVMDGINDHDGMIDNQATKNADLKP